MNEKEIYELILKVAKDDERIRGVILNGSRSNPNCLKDIYQDYDIIYLVKDISFFYNNMKWIEEKFGKPNIVQLPELMKHPLLPPSNDGHFTYLMMFNDYRLDLSIKCLPYNNHLEPAVVLMDKDNNINIKVDLNCFNIKKPNIDIFKDCCNEFWWCLNNVGKGIKREEIPFVKEMFNHYVRNMLNQMVDWYIGIKNNFQVSSGKMGKYYKDYLPNKLYQMYLSTYSDSNILNIWNSVEVCCNLFKILAKEVSEYFNFFYNKEEEINMLIYLNNLKQN